MNTRANKHHSPHAHKLRKGRRSIPGQVYAVSFVTHNRARWFEQLGPARITARSLAECESVRTLCFVVMPDHVHWMIQLGAKEPLSSAIRRVKSASGYRLNQYLDRKGRFWQPGFHDHAIRSEQSQLEFARYIIANPVRAGLVKSVSEYPHWDAIWIGK